jgi:KAP family P-loop domain
MQALLLSYLQVIIAAVPIAVRAIKLLRDYRKSKTAAQTGAAAAAAPRLDADLLDLSFVLLFACLVSFLLTNSLLISGRIVTLGFWLALQSAIVVFSIGALLYFSYRQGKTAMTIGILSSATLLVLFTAPGGPFHQSQEGADAAPSLLWPVVALLTILSAALFHEFGGPFSHERISGRRLMAFSGVGLMILVSALVLGIQFADAVGEELTPEGTAVLAAIRNPSVPPETRKRVYQILSDNQIAAQYEDQFYHVNSEFDQVRHPSDGKSPTMSDAAFQLEVQARKRLDFTTEVLDGFKSLDQVDELAYTKARLGFVHPLGELNNRRAPVPLPGRKAVDRYQAMSDLRQVRALSLSGRSLSVADHGFSYPFTVVRYFGGTESDNRLRPRPPRYLEALFPKAPTQAWGPTFDNQLGLPTDYEAYVAYGEYRTLAVEYMKSHLPKGLQDLSKDIDALPIEAKRAYRHYDDSAHKQNGNESDLPAILAEFSDVDFTPMKGKSLESVDHLFQGTPPDDPDLAALYAALSRKPKKLRDLLRQLANEENLQIRLDALLDPELLRITRQSSAAGIDKALFSRFLTNPVTLGLQELIDKDKPLDNRTNDLVQKGEGLSDSERETVLFFLATSLYEGGTYAPSVFSQLVLDAGLIGKFVMDVAAALLFLPLLAVCIFAGDFSARRLAARETLYGMMRSEMDAAAESSTLAGKAVDLVGREATFARLQDLTRRGWATIALAGRRGVGKSRMLQKLKESYGKEAIAVWMFAPARFSESEFVEDVFERLATATEEAIGRKVRAKPVVVRNLEARSSRVGAAMFAICLGCVALLVATNSDEPARSEFAISWVPAGLLMIASVLAVVLHFRRLQPADLSSWIEREGRIDSQLALLYRETADALRFIAARKTSSRPSVQLWQERPSVWSAFLFGGLAFTSFIFAIFDAFGDNPDTDSDIIFLFLGLLFLLALVVSFRRKSVRLKGSEVGGSLILLVERYREFAATTVRRIKKGAFGPPTDHSSVIICIDELDKIVDFQELRQFIRTVKSIFEIPGVSYYLSISEDALAALHLGSSLGKNEVDSAFDHIITVPPLSLEAAEQLTLKYIQFLHEGAPQAGVARMIAAMSFGVPRDVVRRCDELAKVLGRISPADAVQQWLGLQLDMGEASGFLSSDVVNRLRSTAGDRIELLLDELRRNGEHEPMSRYFLLLGTLILLFEGAGTSEDVWRERSLELSSFGYGLPTRRVSDLLADFKLMVSKVRRTSSTLGD